jgi:hypothetical protein
MTLYKQPDLLPLDQAVYSAGRKPGFFISRALQLKRFVVGLSAPRYTRPVHKINKRRSGFAGAANTGENQC